MNGEEDTALFGLGGRKIICRQMGKTMRQI